MNTGKIVTVSGVQNGVIRIVGAGEQRVDVPVAGDIEYMPRVGDKVFIAPFEDHYCCVGVVNTNTDLEQGEKLIQSGGGYIRIKTSGDVVINGLVISKDGVITEGKTY